MKCVLLLLLVTHASLLCDAGTGCQPEVATCVSEFYPYGGTQGDSRLRQVDDGSSPRITLSKEFNFFGQRFRNLYVNSNGVISFQQVFTAYSPQLFPTGRDLIAPYWDDVDTRVTGNVYYRETNDSRLLDRATGEIQMSFPSQFFTATNLFIATWDAVGHYDGNTERTNTFQCVLSTDETNSFVMFLYADQLLQWTLHNATVGYDTQNRTNFFNVPESGTIQITNITRTSNIDIPGIWMFQTGIGNEFYLGFFDHLHLGHPSIVLMTTESQNVSYCISAPGVGFYQSGIVTNNSEVIVDLPSSLIITSVDQQDRGIYLRTSSSRVNVIGQSIAIRGSVTGITVDTYNAIPLTTTCTSEYVYFGMLMDDNSDRYSIILVVGTENSTVVKLNAIQTVHINVNGDVFIGRQIVFVINRLQTILVRSTEDLTGTKIVTDKPVSVFSGHQCAQIPSSVSDCGHLIEQIPPTTLWDRVYYTAPLSTRRSYTIKVLAANNSTSIDIFCNGTKEPYTINEGKAINKTLTHQEYCAVSSNKPILVAQFSHGHVDDNDGDSVGDPMMLLLPGINIYSNKFSTSTIRTPHLPSTSHYLNIIVLAQYYQPDKIYLISGGVNKSLDTQEWVPVKVNNVIEAYAAKVNIPEDVVEVIHTDTSVLMTVALYGFASNRGYGHPGGIFGYPCPPTITTHPTSQLTTVSMSVTLNCEGTGRGSITYQWQTRNIIGEQWRNISSSNNSRIIVRNLQESQQYRCIVSNEAGGTRSNVATVTVLKITTHPRDRLVPVGSSFDLTCTSSISSDLTFSWTHDGRDVTGQSTSNGNTSILTIKRVRRRHDGSYVCTVRSSSLSVMSNTSSLTVYGRPTITTHPTSHLTTVSISVTLNCEGTGRGSIAYQWQTRNINDRQWSDISNSNNRRLVVSNLGESQQYRCVVSNEVGGTKSNVATVTVLKITTHPSTTTVIVLQDVRLTCSASVADVTYSWHRDGGSVPSRSRGQNSNTLTIPKVTPPDEGMYYCKAGKEEISVESNRATVRVDASAVVQFNESTYCIYENDSAVQPVLVLNKALSTAITVDIISTDRAATRDYHHESLAVTIPAGSTNVSFNVSIINDNEQEDSEDFLLTIVLYSLPHHITRGTNGSTRVHIVDDDAITVYFEKTALSIHENSSSVKSVLILSRPSSTDITIQVDDIPGCATRVHDYHPGPYFVTFIAGETNASFNIAIVDHHSVEYDEDFHLSIAPTALPDGIRRDYPNIIKVYILDAVPPCHCSFGQWSNWRITSNPSPTNECVSGNSFQEKRSRQVTNGNCSVETSCKRTCSPSVVKHAETLIDFFNLGVSDKQFFSSTLDDTTQQCTNYPSKQICHLKKRSAPPKDVLSTSQYSNMWSKPFNFKQHFPLTYSHPLYKRQEKNDDFRYLLFILDTSGSIGEYDFDRVVTILSDLVLQICDKVKVAVMTFSNVIHQEICFDSIVHGDTDNDIKRYKNNLSKRMKCTNYRGGLTYSGEAVCCACDHMLSSSCNFPMNATVDILFLTDGHSNGKQNVCKAAEECFDTLKGDVIALGIGNSLNRAELECIIGKNENKDHVFQLDSTSTLEVVEKEINKLARKNLIDGCTNLIVEN